jgi:hypothetical protein
MKNKIHKEGWLLMNASHNTGVQQNREKQNPQRKPNTAKLKNVADTIKLSLFMDGTEKCKLPFTPCSKHWLKQNSTYNQENGEILNLETSQVCSYGG